MNVDANTVMLALVVLQLQRLIPTMRELARGVRALLDHHGIELDPKPVPAAAADNLPAKRAAGFKR